MTHSSFSGFFRLTHEDWLEISSQLTFAEVKVLLYFLTLDPFGDRSFSYSLSDLTSALSLSKSAVSKALVVLQGKGYLSVDRVSLKSLTVSSRKQAFRTGNDRCVQETSVSYRKQAFRTGNEQLPKPAPVKRSEVPQTNKTNKTNKTLSLPNLLEPLSEEERESFLNFANSKIDLLQKPPALRQKWIAANWDELWQEFAARPQTVAAAAAAAARSTIPQEGDPEFYSWLLTFWRCPQDLYDGAADPVDRQRRVEFSKWAQMEADFERILSPEDYGIEGLAG